MWSIVQQGKTSPYVSRLQPQAGSARTFSAQAMQSSQAQKGEELQTARMTHETKAMLKNARLCRHSRALNRVDANRRMRKTACPVVWEP